MSNGCFIISSEQLVPTSSVSEGIAGLDYFYSEKDKINLWGKTGDIVNKAGKLSDALIATIAPDACKGVLLFVNLAAADPESERTLLKKNLKALYQGITTIERSKKICIIPFIPLHVTIEINPDHKREQLREIRKVTEEFSNVVVLAIADFSKVRVSREETNEKATSEVIVQLLPQIEKKAEEAKKKMQFIQTLLQTAESLHEEENLVAQAQAQEALNNLLDAGVVSKETLRALKPRTVTPFCDTDSMPESYLAEHIREICDLVKFLATKDYLAEAKKASKDELMNKLILKPISVTARVYGETAADKLISEVKRELGESAEREIFESLVDLYHRSTTVSTERAR